ncbi:MAG: hypothetical protein IJL26_02455 [Clostridia bacterium]|nr:hypothetical protein [Clostridia bacterium]
MLRNFRKHMKRAAVISLALSFALFGAGCAAYRQKDVFALIRDFSAAGGGKIDFEEILVAGADYYLFPAENEPVRYVMRVRTDEFDAPYEASVLFRAGDASDEEAENAEITALLRAFCETGQEEGEALLRLLTESESPDGENRSVSKNGITLTESRNELYRVATVSVGY